MIEHNNNKYYIPGDMPAPTDDAIEHSKQLEALIREEISDKHTIPFSRFMELALYSPGMGYYSAGSKKLGAAGDFITAPEISPLFARCIAKQCEQVLPQLDKKQILEVGAGSGIMAADILLALDQSDHLPENYFILETSADLRHRQQTTINKDAKHLVNRVIWLDALPEGGFEGIILANELLDAMPVQKFRINNSVPFELFVGIENNRLTLLEQEINNARLKSKLDSLATALPDNYESEINLNAEAWIQSISNCMHKGLVLLIDYGYPQHEYYHKDRTAGTLMCYYQHYTHDDPFALLGLQDITTHVDFTAIAQSADDAGFNITGYTTQAFFLLGCGLESMAQDLINADLKQRIELSQQIKKLTLPSEMGEQFKVMALSKQLDTPLIGFRLADHRARLLPLTQ